MISMEQFALEMAELARDLPDGAEEWVKGTAELLKKQAEDRSPVDTGESKSGWRWVKRDPLYHRFENQVVQASINDKGRRRSRGKNKMIGSIQAKQGVAKAAVRKSLRAQKKEVDKTIGKVFGGGPRRRRKR